MRRTVQYLELARRVRLDGIRRSCRFLEGALERGVLSPNDFSIQELAEALITDRSGRSVGHEWVRQLGPQKSGRYSVMEAANGVSITNFTNITGQLMYSAVMEGYQQDEFVLSGIIPNIPTKLSGEKIPGITGLYEAVREVGPGQPYPELGFGEDYIETPATTKKGLIVSVDKEAIFFDRTGQVLQRASQVGEVLGRKKEKNLCNLLAGIVNNYKWRGTSYNTYQTATPWINTQSGTELLDWTDVDAAEQLFANMLEPNTDEPVMVSPDTVIYMPYKNHTAPPNLWGYGFESNAIGSNYANRCANTVQNHKQVVSKFLYRTIIASGVSASDAKKWWFLGNPAKAFAYMENWPITVVQAPDNSEADFKQDVVARFKASERGKEVVRNPRMMAKMYEG